MQLIFNAIVPIPSFFDDAGGRAHLRIFRAPGKRSVMILGELDDNPSTSITNNAEQIWPVLTARHAPEEPSPEWIEFYPRGLPASTPSYAIVTTSLTNGTAQWEHIPVAELEAKVGHHLPTWSHDEPYTQSTAIFEPHTPLAPTQSRQGGDQDG